MLSESGHAPDSRLEKRTGSAFLNIVLEATLDKAVEAGGRVIYPRTAIGELGWVAEFEDSEGNCIALHQPRL